MTEQLHTLLTDLAGPPKVIDPAAVKARAARLEAERRRRRLAIVAVAAAVLLVGGAVVLRTPRDTAQRIDVTDTTEAPTTVAPSGWTEIAQLDAAGISPASTMQDDGRTLLWTGSLVVIPGISEAITFDPATATFGSLPAARFDLAGTRGSYRGNLPWVWTGQEILRIDPTPIPADGPGSTNDGPLVGQAYSPATGTWRRMAEPLVHHFSGVAWADDQLLAWGMDGVHAYQPGTDTWRVITTERGSAYDASSETATWTGTELVAMGRDATAAFDPAQGTWRTLSGRTAPDSPTSGTVPSSTTTGAGVVRVQWTGTEVVAYDATTGTIHRLDLGSGTWRTSPSNGYVNRTSTRSALWTGDRFVVWGGPVFSYADNGSSLEGYAQDGAAWDPNTDSWSPIADLPEGTIPMSGVAADDRFLALFQAGDDPSHDDRMVVLELRP